MRVRNFLVMRLFAKMKMRRNRVLEEVNQEISREDEEENEVSTLRKCIL